MKVYRMAESKELQISNVSRVIKENAIDCILSSKEVLVIINLLEMCLR